MNQNTTVVVVVALVIETQQPPLQVGQEVRVVEAMPHQRQPPTPTVLVLRVQLTLAVAVARLATLVRQVVRVVRGSL